MTNYVLHCEPGHFHVSPLGFHRYAADFLDAFNYHLPSHQPFLLFSPVSYYLVCRSLELSLKSFLLCNGMSKKDIKNSQHCGHDLEKIFKKADELGIKSICSFSDKEQDQILKANVWYATKGFEYFEFRDVKTLPDLEVLKLLAERILKAVEPLCLKATLS